jgi:hypothetical protein
LFPTGIPDSTQHPILVQRPPNPNRDHARVVIDLEDHNPLEAIRARDEDAESAVGIRLNCSDRAPWSRWSLRRRAIGQVCRLKGAYSAHRLALNWPNRAARFFLTK